jgi:flagellar hook-basal body complex protein FliE
MVIITIIMGVVVPQGSKFLDGFKKSIDKTKERQKLSKERSYAFIKAEEKNIDILDVHYHISSKGVLTKYEKSNDNN